MNPWTSSGQDSESCAVDQAWLPLHKIRLNIKDYFNFVLEKTEIIIDSIENINQKAITYNLNIELFISDKKTIMA